MRTHLPEAITSVEEAKAFLQALCTNNEAFHPEDDAHDIVWGSCPHATEEECDLLNKLMGDIYDLPDVPEKFDPCGFLIDIGSFT